MSRRRSSRTSTQAVTLSTEAVRRQERLLAAGLAGRTTCKGASPDNSAPTRARELLTAEVEDSASSHSRSSPAAAASSQLSTLADRGDPSGPQQLGNRHKKASAERARSSCEYEWETVLDTRDDAREFLVKWKGWPVSHATWEPADQLPREIIEHYRAECGQSTQASEPAQPTSQENLTAGGSVTDACSAALGEHVNTSCKPGYASGKDLNADDDSSVALDANAAAERPKRRRSVPAHAPVQKPADARLSVSELREQLTAMGFSASQVASGLSWAENHPKATTAAILDRVLVQKQTRKPEKQSGAAKLHRRHKPAERSTSFTSAADSPTTAAEALLLAGGLHNRVRVQVSLIRREEGMLEAYSGERAQARTVDSGGLVVPHAELQRAMARIAFAKRKIRSSLQRLWELQSGSGPGPCCFHQLSPAALETENTENPDAEDGENGIDYADIICSACGSGEHTVADEHDVDILLCDAPGCRLAFHNTTACVGKTHALQPEALKSLLSEDSTLEEQEWWCPLCTVMYNCVDLINEAFERSYSADLSKWALIFSEAEGRGTSQTESEVGSAHDAGNSTTYRSDTDEDFTVDEGDDGDQEKNRPKQEEELRNLDQFSEEMLRHHLQKRCLSTKGKRAVLKTRLQRALSTAVAKPQPRQAQNVRRAMDLSRILHGGNGASAQPQALPTEAAAAAAVDECASSSDIELDDEDEEDRNADEHAPAAGGCRSTGVAQVFADNPSTASAEASSGGDSVVSPSPRGRGKRQRQGIDYTCLDIMLFGLPGDVPEEDMVHALSLGGRRKVATGTTSNPREEGTSELLQGPNKQEAEGARGGSGTHSGSLKRLGQESGHRRKAKRSGSPASSVTAASASRSSSLSLLLGDATSDGEGDWSPPQRRRSSKAKSTTSKQARRQSSTAAGAAAVIGHPADEEADEDEAFSSGSDSSSSSSDEDTPG